MEDKLSHSERLRLECLAQAIAASAVRPSAGNVTTAIIATAKQFEGYVSDTTVRS